MSQNVDAIREAHEAFLRQDVEAVLGHFDEQIVWKVPETLPWGGTYTSREDVAGLIAGASPRALAEKQAREKAEKEAKEQAEAAEKESLSTILNAWPAYPRSAMMRWK